MDRFNAFLDRIGAGEGIWLLAISGLSSLVGMLLAHRLAGGEFVTAFTAWCVAVFGASAIAGFRDWGKPSGPAEPKP